MQKKRDKKQILPSHLHLAESLKKAANSENTRKLLLGEELFALENTERSLKFDQIVTLQQPYEIADALGILWDEGSPTAMHVIQEAEFFDVEVDALEDVELDKIESDVEVCYYSRLQEPEWRFHLSVEFVKSITKLDKKLKGRILEAISKLTKYPMTPTGNTIKPLTNDKSGLWRYRVGDYRLIYSPHEREREIVLISFMPRGSAYA